MKRTLILVLSFILLSTVAMADSIAIYGDEAGTDDCPLGPPAPQAVYFYLVQKTVNGSTGSRFKVVNQSSWIFGAQVLNGFQSTGDAFADLSLGYGSCLAGPNIALLSLHAFSFPYPGDRCMYLEVAAAPGQPSVLAVDCGLAELPASTGIFFVNNDGTCPCLVNAAEQSTWGKLKSFYR